MIVLIDEMEVPLKNCVVSDDEILEIIKWRIFVNEYYTNEEFKAKVMDLCLNGKYEQREESK